MKYFSDKKTHTALDSQLFKKLDHVNNAFYEVELAKAQIEIKEPIIFGFFCLQYANNRMLKFLYKFVIEVFEVNKFEEPEKESDSFYLALAGKKLENCVRPGMKAEWDQLRSKAYKDIFTADPVGIFSPNVVRQTQKQHDKREPGLLGEELRCRELVCPCSKRTSVMVLTRTSL